MYLGSIVVLGVPIYFINNRRAIPLTIPRKPFTDLLVYPDEEIRNAAVLAVCVSDFLDVSNQGLTDLHMRAISEGIRASNRIAYLK